MKNNMKQNEMKNYNIAIIERFIEANMDREDADLIGWLITLKEKGTKESIAEAFKFINDNYIEKDFLAEN
jgi:hypothetical protein